MQVVHEQCCGLDVHKKTVVACLLTTQADGGVRRHVRTFGTMTADHARSYDVTLRRAAAVAGNGSSTMRHRSLPQPLSCHGKYTYRDC